MSEGMGSRSREVQRCRGKKEGARSLYCIVVLYCNQRQKQGRIFFARERQCSATWKQQNCGAAVIAPPCCLGNALCAGPNSQQVLCDTIQQ